MALLNVAVPRRRTRVFLRACLLRVVFSERSGFRRKRGWTENCFSESVRIISYILVSYAMNIVSL